MRRKSNQPLWEVSVTTVPEAESAVTTLLSAVLSKPAVSFTHLDSGRTTASVYLVQKPDWPATRAALRAALEGLDERGLATGACRCRLRQLRSADWAESWKRHFKPLSFGRRLLVKPSWSRRRGREGQAVVELDPGLSFGTGQHPTTGFCLEELVRRRATGKRQALLDAGTGSGILAIAAARLGYKPVDAFDFDPEAVRVARRNARRNRAAVGFRRLDVTRLPLQPSRRYAVVCANLTSDLLRKERDRLVNRVAPGGFLVLAGILRNEFGSVRRAYSAAGLRLVAARSQGEWRSGCFTLA